jgi:hypothetical protein
MDFKTDKIAKRGSKSSLYYSQEFQAILFGNNNQNGGSV